VTAGAAEDDVVNAAPGSTGQPPGITLRNQPGQIFTALRNVTRQALPLSPFLRWSSAGSSGHTVRHWWTQGSEPAFTLVPNFLLTGLIATFIGLLMILWSLRFLQKSYGPTVFLLFGVTSFLTGGGMAQVLLFTLNWLVATRIRASLGL